jgi:hypothetical protein
VDQAVDRGRGRHRVLEDLIPGAEDKVARDKHGAALVALCHESEEDLDLVRGLLHVADVVDLCGAPLDELGYLSFDARGADLLYQVFNRRYQRASTIVTTNLPFKDWGKLFHNSAAASAIADRLVHKGLLVRITGKSKRYDQETE